MTSSATPVSLVGVSIPRSGHHFLANLLQAALGSDLSYCEFYSATDCCRQIPCTRPHRARIVYQKNHDLDLAVDPDLTGVRYVVQYRSPVPAVISDRELFAEVRGSKLARDPSQYLMVLSEKAAHYTRFYNKWVRRPRASTFSMKYEWLLEEPARALDALIRFCGLVVPPEAIERAVAVVAPVVKRPPIVTNIGDTKFTPRDPSRSEYFDRELLAVYEALVLDRVPELAAGRTFAPVGYAKHPLLAMFEVQCARLDGRHEDAAGLALAAQRQWPADAYINYVAAECLRKVQDRETALSCLECAVEGAPHDAQIIAACANVNLELGRIPRGSELASQLVALVPTEPGYHLFLANTLLMSGKPEQALARALDALDLGIRDNGHWHQFANIVTEARRMGWKLSIDRPEEN